MKKLARFAAMAWIAAAVASGASGLRADDPPAEAKLLEACWVDLAKFEPDSSRALLKMAGRPKEATAFLKDRMKPLKVDPARVQFLLTMLNDENEAIWKPAFEELDNFDPRLAIDLETLMADTVMVPARQRLVEVLSGRPPGSLNLVTVNIRRIGGGGEGFNFFSSPGGSWWAEHRIDRINASPWGNTKKQWTRSVRAIALLESFGTPEAVAIIREMATGHPEAQVTKVAGETLARIAAASP